MRRVVPFLLLLALAAGCGKGESAPVPEGPKEPAFSETSPDDTLAWVAARRVALHTNDDTDNGPALKAAFESMKGRSLSWPAKVAQINLDGTFSLTSHSVTTDPPGPRGEEKREWHCRVAFKPFKPGAAIPEDAPFVRSPEPGFPSAGGDWTAKAKRGQAVKVTGTVAAVQLHRRAWVTGYGMNDRVVHSELAITLHLEGGTVSPEK
jgi:hypothetical protein